MPLGITRLNVRKSQPNNNINFIKPLKGPDEAIAQDFLERIAAQCVPVMREHHIAVMSLEEFPPNREFVGRNFNAGEVIQLVLKSASTGQWLPFNYVQMVMMHELAHCKQMNHSKAFWAVRNNYAEQMRTLWTRGYTGEGLWGRGTLLTTGKFEANTVAPDEPLPEHLCGGTYRSRRRKRKAKDQPTYQQRKERRILKKFGANGVALGQDEEIKAELEKGKRTQSKPRVAQSKRGRELRAAAALARFDKQKQGEEQEEKKEELVKAEDETATEDDFETSSETEDEATGATDLNGERLVDGKGNRLIKVCEDESPEDDDAQQELRELQSSMADTRSASRVASSSSSSKVKPTAVKLEDDNDDTAHGGFRRPEVAKKPPTPKPTAGSSHVGIKPEPGERPGVTKETLFSEGKVGTSSAGEGQPAAAEPRSAGQAGTGVCPMCSFENGPVSLTCSVCSHVLDGKKDPKAWKCDSTSCRDSQYLNAGDAGICGLCGRRKPA